MNRDDLVRMAREAGSMDFGADSAAHVLNIDVLERFAALVAAAESEACAQVCDHYATALDGGDNHYLRSAECRQAAAKIRARGKQ